MAARLNKYAVRLMFSIVLLSLVCLRAGAQRHTISGYMSDAVSGETLIGAAVLDARTSTGAVSNNYGFYTITLQPGKVSLEFACLGYESIRMEFELGRDTVVNVKLSPSVEALEGAKVTASRSETGVRGSQMSAVEIPSVQLKSIPALAGEVDVIKAIQLLPGVQSGTEGSAGLYVRGGGPDENLLLLDGVPLYNVNHMLGFFSVFNADAVKNVTLYKGSFPARFGSRLSSVVDVRMEDGDQHKIHGGASIGLLSAKFNLEGPIVKERTTFDVSARRTYFDVLALPVLKVFSKSVGLGSTGGYYFYDFNAKVTHRFSDRDKVYLSWYMGDDTVYARIKDETDKISLGWNWGNMVGSAHWTHVFGPKLFANTTISYTRYRHRLDVDYSYEDESPDGTSDKEKMGIEYDSLINDLTAATDFEWRPSPSHDVRFGASYTYHRFKPSVTTIYASDIDTTFGENVLDTHEASVYAEDNWDITRWFKFNLGLRYSLYGVSGRTYQSLEPRVSLRVLACDDLSFKASYSEMSQYIHLLSNSNLSLPTDLWVPVTGNIEPMRSRQVAAGVFYSLNTLDFSVEGYYKSMDNVLEYKDGASFFGSTKGWEEKVASGIGWAYGVEFLLQKKAGKTTGWIGYTWSKAMRLFDRPGQELNFGRPFPAKYDRRHDLSITVSHAFNRKIDVSATFVYGTGTCGSLATQKIISPEFINSYGVFSGFREINYLDGRNNYRLPDYHRLDLGVNFNRFFKNGCSRTINVSVYNVYNRQNPFIVYEGHSDSHPALMQMSVFPILPSISYAFKF